MALRELIPWRIARRSEHEHPLVRWHGDMEKLFEDFFRKFDQSRFEGLERNFVPRVDFRDTEKEVLVTAELPGLNEKDVEITLERGSLLIRGEKSEDVERKEKGYYRKERSFGSFQRVIPLDVDIDDGKVEATFKNGVLSIRLPKLEGAGSSRRRIEVKAK